MATQSPPFVQQDASHSAALFRQTIAALLGRTQPGTLAYTAGGIVNATDLAVTQHGTANMSVTVAGGACFIPQTQAANGGLYFGLNDATVNLAISAANATNPRIDLVCASVLDKAYSGATTKFEVQVLTGTPTSGATLTNLSGAPSLPAASIPLAYVLVPANASSIVSADIKSERKVLSRPSNPISCRVHTSGSVTDVNTTLSGTICPFDTIDWDTAGGFSTSTHQYTVQVAGKYRVTGFWKRYTKTAVGITCWLKKNGSTILPVGTSGGATGALSSSYTSNVGSVATDLVQCAVNDTLELVYLDYGGGANAGGSMTIEYVGP